MTVLCVAHVLPRLHCNVCLYTVHEAIGLCDSSFRSLQGITPCSLSKETVFGVEGPMQLASRHPLNQDPPLLTLHGETPSTTAATFKGNDSVAIFVGTRNGSVREVS